jgi:hypothetical protein
MMEDVKRVSLVMNGGVLLGARKVTRRLRQEPEVSWRPFSLTSDRTFMELGEQPRRGLAEQAVRNSWGVKP